MEKFKLPGGPDKTVTWVWLEGGQLKVEFYDFSETAQRMFGNDVAYTLTVGQNETKRLYSLASQGEHSLLEWIPKTFRSYFGIKRWLDENQITYRVEMESWA